MEHQIVGREGQTKFEARLIDPLAKLPTKTRITDVGYDIYSIENKLLLPSTATIVRTGIQISAPPGYYYTIEGRSSLWSKGIFPNRGIIDSTYCGELVVSLINLGREEYRICHGDRIAQIIGAQQINITFCPVEEFSPDYNQRGQNGFGSSGK